MKEITMTNTKDLDGAMLAIYRRGMWKTLTFDMTTEQREAAAEAVERAGGIADKRQPLRWWLPPADGLSAVERLCRMLGQPVPQPMTEAERREYDAWMDECDRQVIAFYANPERHATPGPVVLPAPPPLRSEHGR